MRQFKRLIDFSRSAVHSGAPRALLSRAVRGVADRLFAGAMPGPSQGALRAVAEPLEPRKLLTTLLGGDSFNYLSFDFGDIDDEGEFETFPAEVLALGNPETEIELYAAGFGFDEEGNFGPL